MKTKLEPSCRVAFAAYVHDLGKLAERARIGEAEAKDAEGNSVADRNKQQYCPGWNGRWSHVHAAYTAIALDLIEDDLPPLKGRDVSPFAAWGERNVDDSLINAAAMHHKPQTFLQWIVATADRVASGFEREEFDRYNQAEEGASTGRDHYTARLLTLFEQIRLDGEAPRNRADFRWRYPLEPLSVAALFPQPADACEGNDRQAAQAEYRRLWDGFRRALKEIPASHRDDWALWLDHFDSLWAAFAHAVPAATAGKVRPEVSLYDHSRTASALATALWRWHDDRGDDPKAAAEAMRTRSDWDENKFLLVLGDFYGIQDFIFTSGGETQRQAAKLLRGRSFYVSLLCECAALRILEELGLPPTSQVINAAGKFLIVAPNTEAVRRRLAAIQRQFDRWFLERTYAASGIGIAWQAACCNDFLHRRGETERPFARLLKRLFDRLEDKKSQRLNLCAPQAPEAVFKGFLDAFDNEKGVCAIDGRSPASEKLEGAENRYISPLAADQIDTGKWLAHHDRLLVTTRAIDHHTLRLDLFGYHISFTGPEEASGRFGPLVREGALRRAWDFSLPQGKRTPLFSGYARRFINAYVPLLGDLNQYDRDRYRDIELPGDWDPRAPKTFEHLARDDLRPEGDGWVGTEALTVLKGDVDNLGLIFQKGLEQPSFAKWASLSRQMNAFFAVWLPWYCREHYRDTYTVFAGGDDFFLIGPWYSTIRLARDMRDRFHRYVAKNPGLHFSAGLSMTKPGQPVRQLGKTAEDALEDAKALPGKNAVTLFHQSVSWDEFEQLWQVKEGIEHCDLDLSTAYLYRLQELAHLAGNVHERPENAIWKSWFSYRTFRMLERMRGLSDQERRRRMAELWKVLGEPIERFGSRFVIPLFIHLYQQRH
ncbi:CRISPR-associated protein Csm1 [Methylomarinovum tepidoasis]|uniref:CRISPR system single-strand-specific deoxyribonuclease Cas10/Csm1 (subtype III-A) n=1 Tax=Methylomarinovum tepidoasis TaxID=2840183 RepID=A0AAU9CMR6_9GAMM|nr:type III-A CRISPR-associated protein Cas10/Csm1 [Methylomarinovum sp. IN45]BCX88942.1 CRISPR-associated protein Csm1 [Methylomarinovum sp. IN45]